jgi:hypothetical protein
LLTGAELIAYVHEPGVAIEGAEWTGDIVVGAGGQPVALVVTDASQIAFAPLIGTEFPFRCVTLPCSRDGLWTISYRLSVFISP